MKRLALILSPLAVLGAACITVPAGPVAEVPPPPVAYPAPAVYPAPAPAPARGAARYGGEHFVPDAYGGGWCYESRPHHHDYYPDRPDAYVVEGGYYYYRGPLAFTYYEGHPTPSGGWCYARGPHTHEFLPPSGRDWRWRRDRGYVYQGDWRPQRPPPATYWPRVVPRRSAVPAAAPYPSQPAPAPYAGRPAPGRPLPAPAPQYLPRPVPAPAPLPAAFPRVDDRGQRDAAPGHGNLPPGHGGTPPGQVTAPSAPPDRREDRAGPGRSDRAPGHGDVPPGQGGIPPGQRNKVTTPAAPAASPAPAAAAAPPATAAPAPTRQTAPAPAKGTPSRRRSDPSDDAKAEENGRAAPRENPTR
jgi:hypothetical protein